MKWKLKRTVQCSKCPWRKSTNPHDIPHGYDVEKHKALGPKTIASGDYYKDIQGDLHVMACHETHDAHCLGWLMHQLGPGNNVPLRIHCYSCENIDKVKLIGEQHETFEETLPKEN